MPCIHLLVFYSDSMSSNTEVARYVGRKPGKVHCGNLDLGLEFAQLVITQQQKSKPRSKTRKKCKSCSKQGHIAKTCKSRAGQGKVDLVEETDDLNQRQYSSTDQDLDDCF